MNEQTRKLAIQAGMRECSLGYGMPENVLWGESNIQRFADLVVADYARQQVLANMNNREYAQAMDEFYEQRWAHRFD